MADHLVGGTDTTQQYGLAVSNNGGNIIMETNKLWVIMIQFKDG